MRGSQSVSRKAALSLGLPLLVGLAAQASHGGVIAHWNFDAPAGGVYPDETGVHNATITTNGAGAVATSVPGQFGNAVNLGNSPGAQGTNNVWLAIPQLTEIMGPTGTSFSVATWVDTTNTADDNTVLADWGNAPAGGNRFSYWFLTDNVDGNTASRPRFQLRQGTGNGTDIVARTSPAPTTVADDNWHHIAWTWDKPAGILTTYVDGTAVDTFGDDVGEATVDNADILVSDSPVGSIGRKSDNNRFYVGSLDEMWVFNQVLTPGEVESLRTTNMIPEPATITLAGVAGALLLLRRRQDA